MVERTNNLSSKFILKLETERYQALHDVKIWRMLCGVLLTACVSMMVANIYKVDECKQQLEAVQNENN